MRILLYAAIIALPLSGCVSNEQGNKETLGTVIGGVAGALLGSRVGSGKGQLAAVAIGALAGAWIGNTIGSSLDEADQAAVKDESAKALETAQDGQTIAWNNPDSGAKAEITSKNTRVETRTVPMLREKRVEPLPALTLIGKTYVAHKSANVRLAPTTSSEIVSGFAVGETFHAVGMTAQNDWVVVAKNNRTIGYVYAPLVSPYEGIIAKNNTSSANGAPEPQAPALRPTNDAAALTNDGAIDLDKEGLVIDEVAATTTCRTIDLQIQNGKGENEASSFDACKGSDGAWEIL